MIVLQLLRAVIAFCCLFEGLCALAAAKGEGWVRWAEAALWLHIFE